MKSISSFIFLFYLLPTNADFQQLDRSSTPRVEVRLRTAARHLASETSHLNYYGGPVIANVKVITIWWGAGVQYTSELEKFYAGITNSKWMRIMSEYSTSRTIIGTGSWLRSYNYTNAPPTSTGNKGILSDGDIQSNLLRLIDNGLVPPPDKNSYYAIHFAPNIKIRAWSRKCGNFCGENDAYHFTIRTNASSTVPVINYGVIPHLNGGNNKTNLKRLCSISSHILAEVITNPVVRSDKSNTFPSGWLTTSGNETADICDSEVGTTVGSDGVSYTIQTIWSNKDNKCIANAPRPDWTVISSVSVLSAVGTVDSGAVGLAFAVISIFLSFIVLLGLACANKKKQNNSPQSDEGRWTKGLNEDDEVKTTYDGDDASTVIVANKL